MKRLLIILLLSLVSCQKTDINSIFETFQCILKSKILQPSYDKIVEAFKSKDLFKIISTCYSVFLELKEDIIKCRGEQKKIITNNENENDDDIRLGYPRPVLVLYAIIKDKAVFDWYEKGGLKRMKEECYKLYGQGTWYCEFIRKQE